MTNIIKQRYHQWSEILNKIDPVHFYHERRVSDRLTEKGMTKKFKQWSKENCVKDVQGSSYQNQLAHYCKDNNIDFDMIDVAYLQKENILNGWKHEDCLKLKDGKKWEHCKQDVDPEWFYVRWVGNFDSTIPSVQVESIARVFGDHGHGYQYYHRHESPDARPFDEVSEIFTNETLENILKIRQKYKQI